MSLRAMCWAKQQPAPDITCKALLMLLADEATSSGELFGVRNGVFWIVTQKSLAKMLGVHRHTVMSAMQRLQDHGQLGLLEHRASSGRANKYRLRIPESYDHTAPKSPIAEEGGVEAVRQGGVEAVRQGGVEAVRHRPDYSLPIPVKEKNKQKKKAVSRAVEIPNELPEGLSREVVEDFIEHRAKMHRPKPITTQRSLMQAINESAEVARLNRTTADDVLTTVINNHWQGVPRGENKTAPWFVSKLSGANPHGQHSPTHPQDLAASVRAHIEQDPFVRLQFERVAARKQSQSNPCAGKSSGV